MQSAPNAGDTDQPYISSIGFAPFISGQGSWNRPFTTTTTTTKTTSNKNITPSNIVITDTSTGKTTTIKSTGKGVTTAITKKTSTSLLRFGADFQLGLDTGINSLASLGGLLQENYFYISPFHETDYQGLANINGVDIAWQPVSYRLHLGVAPTNSVFSFMWQLKADTELTQVSNPGYTNFIQGGNHALIGETVRVNIALFPLNSPPIFADNSVMSFGNWFDEHLAGRISFIGTQQYYFDADTKESAPYYSAILQYKLGECKRDTATTSTSSCKIQGSSSLSVEYDVGRDKETFVKTNQFLVKLGYAY